MPGVVIYCAPDRKLPAVSMFRQKNAKSIKPACRIRALLVKFGVTKCNKVHGRGKRIEKNKRSYQKEFENLNSLRRELATEVPLMITSISPDLYEHNFGILEC